MRVAAFTILLTFAAGTLLSAQTINTDKRLVFSTYHGGNRADDAAAVAVDPVNGFIYVTGESESNDLNATPVGGKPLTSAVFKGYLTKYAPDGKTILWRLMIGGSSNTVTKAIALDPNGNIFVAGTTGARDLPLKNPVQDKQPGLNIAFLMKFSPEGGLLFSTYFGGDRNEEGRCLAVDSQGNVYLAGRATSTNMPVKNALQPKFGGSEDGFIAKYSANLELAYATYFGGGASDQIHAIAVGPDDSLYVAGETMSPGLATPGNAYNRQMQSWSSFVARIAPEGDAVTYFNYVGWRGGYTVAKALAVDSAGRAWIGGHTTSKLLPTTENALQKAYAGGMRDGFLLRLGADGTSADYLSYLGGGASGPTDPDESVNALRVDARGHLHVAGQTNSADFPGNSRAFQSASGGAFDGFLLRMDPDAPSQVFYSTFWGGLKNDVVTAVALGPGETVTFVGNSTSPDLPVSATAVQSRAGSADDAFVTQVCDPWLTASQPSIEFVYTLGAGAERPGAVEIDVTAGCPLLKFEINGGSPEISGGDGWLAATGDGGTVPLKLRLEITADPESMEPGEYKAAIRITVPNAYYPTLSIPVTLKIVGGE